MSFGCKRTNFNLSMTTHAWKIYQDLFHDFVPVLPDNLASAQRVFFPDQIWRLALLFGFPIIE